MSKIKVQIYFNKNFPNSLFLDREYNLDDFELMTEFNLIKSSSLIEKDYMDYVIGLLNEYDQMFTSRSISVGDLIVIDLHRYLITNFGTKEF